MHKLIFILFMILNLSAFAGEWSSGGGDPVLVKTLPFPNQATLQDALDLLKQKVQECPYSVEFKKAFLEDLSQLEEKRLFFYVPELFSVGLNRFPGDYETLVSNGAMTEFYPSAPIYFSRQSVAYDARTLARVIAQEIPHHIFSSEIGRNEMFVNALGTYLIVGGKPPSEPYPLAQVIYEEFINHPGEPLKAIGKRAQETQQSDWRWMQAIIDLAMSSYRERGSYGRHNVQPQVESKEDFELRQKVLPLSLDLTLTKTLLKQCTFLTYQDGASGITTSEQEVLVELFLTHLRHYQDLFQGFYYAEEIQLASERELTRCAFGIQGPDNRVLWLQGVYLMNLDQIQRER